MRIAFAALLVTSSFALEAAAADLVVDAAGIASPLTNLTQAMVLASPGDRIFVMPGAYPAFHFSRGVEVVGLGQDPSQVVIARVDFHPILPTHDFDAGLSNVTVCSSNPEDSTSISGNELAEGTFVLQGVVTCGGVYLNGGGDFYLMVVDSRFEPAPGGGFLGAAFTFGGGTADFVDAWVAGADASTALALPAGAGLRVGGGATVRVSNTHVSGGSGASSGLGFLQNAADAIEAGFGAALRKLRLSGHSVVAGGDGGPSGAGGAGVDLIADISTGQATVTGGSGNPAGVPYTYSQPLMLAHDPYLTMQPPKSFANGDPFFRVGQQVLVLPGAPLPSVALACASRIDSPSNALYSPLPVGETHLVNGGQFTLTVPFAFTTRAGGAFPRRRIYFQAFFPDEGGQLVSTNPVAIMLAPN